MRAKLRRCGAVALFTVCVVLAGPATFGSIAAARVLPILVMGDSYSAGNGAGGYFGAKGCWRSPNDYAGVFARALEGAPYDQPTVLDNVACSGDTTHAFAHWTHGRRPQLDAVNKGYGVIFLTVGGDDIDFAGIVQNCLIQTFRDGRKCNALLSAAEQDLRDGTLERRIVDVLDGIRQRSSSQARIVLLGYPYIEGQEHYQIPYGHDRSIDVPKRLRALEDVGDQVEQRAIERLNARYRTTDFVFVKTKGLFAGHELYALSLNPNRWFVAPETDAGLAWRDWWYHPNPTGWYEEGRLLLGDPKVPKHPVTPRPHACLVQRYYLGSSSHGWMRGTAHDPADESLKATTYANGSSSCHPLVFRRWLQIINLVFTGEENEGNLGKEGNGGSFSGPGFKGTWRHLKTVQVPRTCGTGLPNTPPASTLYGWFYLRVSDLNGTLLDTAALKLRLAC